MSILADVSEVLRNLVMDHTNSDPFRRNYLGREICADLWGIIRGQRPQQALAEQACCGSHSISKRRPVDLTHEQLASIPFDPLVKKLSRELKTVPRRSPAYKELKKIVHKEKQRLRRELKQQIRNAWTTEQAVRDIECQIRGAGFAEPSTTSTTDRPQGPAQKQLVEALTAPVETTLAGQYRRRDSAIDAISAYCVVQEGCTRRKAQASSIEPACDATSHYPPEQSALSLAMLSIFVRSEKERPRRCFMCVGQALSLPPGDHHIGELISEFYMPSDLTKHFKRKHLSKLKDDEPTQCRVCDIKLDHKMHLQNHAFRVHGTVS